MAGRHEHRTSVKPEWVDHNGHMNVAFYVLAFDEATDAAYERWGIGLDYPMASGCSVFTLGMNVDYVSELFIDDNIRIETSLVDCDHKRVHYLHTMYNAENNVLAATNECLCMNVNLETRKSASFPGEVGSRLKSALDNDAIQEHLGRVLAIRRDR